MTEKLVVFLRGGRTQEINMWRFYHFDPRREVNIGVIKLVYFDYPAGKIKTWNKWVPERGKAPKKPPDKVDDIEPKVNIRFDDGSIDTDESLPSVLGFYDFLKKQPNQTILSIQIFSHGDYDGPIIWNHSFENVDKDDFSLDRDPHDSEFRRRDFFGKNPLAGGEGAKVGRALATNAFIKIWGCTEDSKYRVMLRKYINTKQDDEGKIKRKQILENYVDVVEKSFALLLAQTLRTTVWSAPVGWGSNPYARRNENFKYTGKFPPNLQNELWWRIPALTREYRQFFTGTLRAPLDSTLYLGYKNSWFQAIKASLRS